MSHVIGRKRILEFADAATLVLFIGGTFDAANTQIATNTASLNNAQPPT